MANNMEASQILKDDDRNEAEEIVQYLPPRFREIAASSTAIECFNLMNDHFVSDRILPALHNRVRPLIQSATLSGPITDRFRHLIDCPLTPPSSNCSLLFRLKGRNIGLVNEIKFLDCDIQNKRLPRFPNQVLERRASISPHKHTEYSSLVAVGEKVVYFTDYDPRNPFSYIMNAAQDSDCAFRPLDTSTICKEIRRECQGEIIRVRLNAAVEHRLIVLLRLSGRNPQPTHTLCLDVNTEKWSLLQHCPLRERDIERARLISWHGKLYLLINEFPSDVRHFLPFHLDIERNMWVEHDTGLAARLAEAPRTSFHYFSNKIISSRSGTLYSRDPDRDNQENLDIYAMEDMKIGWRPVELRRSMYTQQFNPFAITALPANIAGHKVYKQIEWWPVNEHDILLLVLQYSCDRHSIRWARYAWWIFNQNDGIKTYNSEELSVSTLQNAFSLSVLKIELQNNASPSEL